MNLEFILGTVLWIFSGAMISYSIYLLVVIGKKDAPAHRKAERAGSSAKKVMKHTH